MQDKYSVINLRYFLDAESPSYIDETDLYSFLEEFKSPQNRDVEQFLHKNAVEFTKKSQSVTYLVLDNDSADIVGYFSIAIKPLTIRAKDISKTTAKKLSRVSILDEDYGTFMTSAFLLAQFGKNYAISEEKRISVNDLLELALSVIEDVKYAVGGILEFWNVRIINFY